MRIAHLSDLHFAKLSFDPRQFLSKQWLGNLNLLFNRSKTYCNERPFALIPHLKQLGIELCLITGDFTTTGSASEYRMAKAFTDELEKNDIRFLAIPGNHDCYTRKNAKQKTFYRYFPERFDSSAYSLKYDRLTTTPLCTGWNLIALDTAVATSLISSTGLFPKSLEEILPEALESMPSGRVLMMNHFPFFEHERKRRLMKRGPALKAVLEKNEVDIYLHGHTHRLCLADLRSSHLPIILDSGSAAHHMLSSFNVLDLTPNACNATVYQWNNVHWDPIKEENFTW